MRRGWYYGVHCRIGARHIELVTLISTILPVLSFWILEYRKHEWSLDTDEKGLQKEDESRSKSPWTWAVDLNLYAVSQAVRLSIRAYSARPPHWMRPSHCHVQFTNFPPQPDSKDTLSHARHTIRAIRLLCIPSHFRLHSRTAHYCFLGSPLLSLRSTLAEF